MGSFGEQGGKELQAPDVTHEKYLSRGLTVPNIEKDYILLLGYSLFCKEMKLTRSVAFQDACHWSQP